MPVTVVLIPVICRDIGDSPQPPQPRYITSSVPIDQRQNVAVPHSIAEYFYVCIPLVFL
jgi:hypothetical protein